MHHHDPLASETSLPWEPSLEYSARWERALQIEMMNSFKTLYSSSLAPVGLYMSVLLLIQSFNTSSILLSSPYFRLFHY
jgi:hypothetical protein